MDSASPTSERSARAQNSGSSKLAKTFLGDAFTAEFGNRGLVTRSVGDRLPHHPSATGDGRP